MLAARLATPFCVRFPKRSSLLKKDPHAQTSLNRMFLKCYKKNIALPELAGLCSM
jgi:hypothetical protein